MKVRYSPRALVQLEEIHAYIATRNPRAAGIVIDRIKELCDKLGDFPGVGTQTDQTGVHVLPVVRYPYLIFYTVLRDADEVRVLRIRHGARKPEPLEPDELG